ncbi:uncharacterized protein LOC128996768 isoform X4 [Macrosteles quadrilineatus]|uniref:uncharacterized protein LOC128996768 isoform X4 n=1 Tax=Macrosteles quadrilineatus TaxID=74068 RepID=UPI0023E230F9|nr:uncharacterized protein LOC128996768 isoform X4 [Macrosteles quadrilineatus]
MRFGLFSLDFYYAMVERTPLLPSIMVQKLKNQVIQHLHSNLLRNITQKKLQLQKQLLSMTSLMWCWGDCWRQMDTRNCFSNWGFNNDVALLKTADAILLSETAKLIPVSETSPSMGDAAVLWTWNSDSTVYKNQADILPMSECKAFYPDFDLTESNVCAVLDHVLPFQVSLYGSPLVYKGALVGLYMGMEANVYKPSLCSNLSPLVGWVHAMMKNETATQLLFPLSN